MREKHAPMDEEKRTNRRSFIIGIFIGLAFIIFFTILYYHGLIQ